MNSTKDCMLAVLKGEILKNKISGLFIRFNSVKDCQETAYFIDSHWSPVTTYFPDYEEWEIYIGTWSIDEWPGDAIVLQSSDFTHDAALEINGDFATKEQKIEYAKKIAKRLNNTKDL